MTHGILNGRGAGRGAARNRRGRDHRFPLLYGFLGFLAGIIGATLFNLVASMVGGIEIELSQGYDPPARSPARPDSYFSDPVTTPGERNPGFHS